MKRNRVSAWRAEPAWIVVRPFTPEDKVSRRGRASAFPELRAHPVALRGGGVGASRPVRLKTADGILHRRAHNPKVAGSNPAPATKESPGQSRCASTGSSVCQAIFYRIFYRMD